MTGLNYEIKNLSKNDKQLIVKHNRSIAIINFIVISTMTKSCKLAVTFDVIRSSGKVIDHDLKQLFNNIESVKLGYDCNICSFKIEKYSNGSVLTNFVNTELNEMVENIRKIIDCEWF